MPSSGASNSTRSPGDATDYSNPGVPTRLRDLGCAADALPAVPLFPRGKPEQTVRVSGDRALVKQITKHVAKLDRRGRVTHGTPLAVLLNERAPIKGDELTRMAPRHDRAPDTRDDLIAWLCVGVLLLPFCLIALLLWIFDTDETPPTATFAKHYSDPISLAADPFVAKGLQPVTRLWGLLLLLTFSSVVLVPPLLDASFEPDPATFALSAFGSTLLAQAPVRWYDTRRDSGKPDSEPAYPWGAHAVIWVGSVVTIAAAVLSEGFNSWPGQDVLLGVTAGSFATAYAVFATLIYVASERANGQ